MPLHRLPALSGVGSSEIALAVAHDQQAAHTFTVAAPLHLCDVGRVLGPVEKELVDVLDSLDTELACRARKVEMIQPAPEKVTVERPLGQRDLEQARLP